MPNEVEITITASDLSGPAFESAKRHMMILRAEARLLGDQMARVTSPDVNVGRMTAGLNVLKSKIQSLGIADIADVNVPYGRLITQMNVIKRFINQAGISDLLDVNIDPQKLGSQMARIRALGREIPISYKVVGPSMPLGLAGMNKSWNETVNVIGAATAAKQMSSLAASMYQAVLAGQAMRSGSAATNTNLAGTASGANKAAGALIAMNAAGNALGGKGGGGGGGRGGGGRGGGWWGLGGTVALFGGLAGAVSLWHIALDATLEAVIAVASAAMALTLTLYAMKPAATDVYNHLHSISVVNSVLGSNIPPLTGKFKALQDQMANPVLEIYGGGINAINTKTGVLGHTIYGTTQLLEGWIAKIDIWAASQRNAGSLLYTGVGYLKQFGEFLGFVGVGISNLIRADPGTAHFLMDAFIGFAKLFEIITKLPQPILYTALALHSIYLWGGLAVTGIKNLSMWYWKLTQSMYGAARAAALFAAANPLVWVAVAAVALGGFIYVINTADASAKRFINDMNNNLSSLTASQAILQINTDVRQLNEQIAQVPAHMMAMKLSAQNAARSFNTDFERMLTNPNNNNISTFFGNIGHAVTGWIGSLRGGADVKAFTGEIVHLTGEQANLFGEIGVLMRGTTTLGATFGRLGVTTHEVTTGAYTYAQALALMDLAGVKASDSAAVMKQKVDNLITGYQNMGVQGGLLSNSVNAVTFATEQQSSNLAALTSGWDAFIKTVTGGETAFVTFAQGVGTLTTNAAVAGSSIGGLNAQSLTLRSTWQQSIGNANQYMDAILAQVSASGLGARGTAMMTQAGKDLVAIMLPMASGSQAATSELYALAQQAGYQGVNSFKALTTWVGNVQNPMQNLNGITGTLATSSSNLTADMNNLANAISQNLNSAMAAAIFQASGGQKAFDNFATAALNAHGSTDFMKSSAQALANQLITTTGNTVLAHQEFDTFAQRLGHSRDWADRLWASLDTLGKQHVTPTVDVHASGSGSINFVETAAYAKQQSGMLIFKAAGGMIGGHGGPKQDNHLVAASTGEYVVNADAVSHYGPGMMHAINAKRFASGGLVGEMYGGPPWAGNVASQFEKTSIANSVAAEIAAFKRSVQAAANAAAAATARNGAALGGDEAANKALAASMYPQYAAIPSVWDAWNYVVMRESGWNRFATNASSGAYGIAQALPPSKYPFAGQAAGGSHAGPQISWMWDYMGGRYGGPIGAADHERMFNWYGSGLNAVINGKTLIGVGDKGAEHVQVTPVGRGGPDVTIRIGASGHHSFDRFLQSWLKENVQVLGGGNVQLAFGSES